MSSTSAAKVVIVGAGSVGVLAGYHLGLAGAEVTFLVRPHRLEQLERPQQLYSYDDNTLTQYSGYHLITDPAALSGTAADFVIVTLDGAALRTEAGLTLVNEIGRAFRGTGTGVILAAVGIGVQPWFVQQSGLSSDQVAMGSTGALIHEVTAAALPVDPAVDEKLLGQADYGYRLLSPAGFTVDDSSPQLATAFTALFTGEGVPAAVSTPADATAVGPAMLAPILAWGLLDWRPLDQVDPAHPIWQLGVESMREIQRLSVLGPAGKQAADQTDATAALETFRHLAQASRPLNFAAFNAYHHGGKVNKQDLEFLEQARQLAAADGADTPALDALIERLTA
jgi:hypothetical protein